MTTGQRMIKPLVRLSDPSGRTSDTDPPQASVTRLSGVSTSRYPGTSQGQAGELHPCRGFGRDEGTCMVRIPYGRVLCHYCARSQAIVDEPFAIDPLIGDLACPACPGILNEDGHFYTLGHRIGVGEHSSRDEMITG